MATTPTRIGPGSDHPYVPDPPKVSSNTTTRILSIGIGAAGVGFHFCTDQHLIAALLCILATVINAADLIAGLAQRGNGRPTGGYDDPASQGPGGTVTP